MTTKSAFDWRGLIARLALVLLAASAAYGVYAFSELFTPWPVAALTAISFEACYIGLACLPQLSERQRREANRIAIWAVIVSVSYNSIAAVAHLSPTSFDKIPGWAVWALSILHGLPLALTGYFLSNLLLHSDNAQGKHFDNFRPVSQAEIDNSNQAAIDKIEPGNWPLSDHSLTEGDHSDQPTVTAFLSEAGPEIDKDLSQELTSSFDKTSPETLPDFDKPQTNELTTSLVKISSDNLPAFDNAGDLGDLDKPRRRTRSKKAELDQEAQQAEIAKLGRAFRDRKLTAAEFDNQLQTLLIGAEV